MTSPAPASIITFPRGHAFSPVTFSLDEARVRGYLAAVGDTNGYAGTVPPLAAVAFGLEALQGEIALPEGSLHTGQEIEHAAALAAGEPLTMTGRIAQRSERQGFVIAVIEFEIAGAAGTAIRARTTIMAPAGAAPGGGS
jgi:hypothetical protein